MLATNHSRLFEPSGWSLQLLRLAEYLYVRLQTLNVNLKAWHILGRLNRLADMFSPVNTEWTMSPAVLTRLWRVWGMPLSRLDGYPS